LAIEIAAAQARALPIEAIAERLGQTLRLAEQAGW
jgi:predicted ATPase